MRFNTLIFAVAGLFLLTTPSPADAAKQRYKIFLSMSYIGNDWQAEAANMIKAMAASPSMADKVD
jgi:ribose transport system substrate-binding protein